MTYQQASLSIIHPCSLMFILNHVQLKLTSKSALSLTSSAELSTSLKSKIFPASKKDPFC